jgi:hypothetical protein
MQKFLLSMFVHLKCTHFHLEIALVIGILMRIRVTNVDDKMSTKTCIQMEGGVNIELELSTDELVDATLGTNSAQDFVLRFG